MLSSSTDTMKTERLTNFESALNRLSKALKQKPTDTNRDSAILRFQLCFDLSWKSIKDVAKSEGVECYSPKSCLRSAFQLGLIPYDETWMAMVDDRNLVAHVYQEKLAKTLFAKLPGYLVLLLSLSTGLKKMKKQTRIL